MFSKVKKYTAAAGLGLAAGAAQAQIDTTAVVSDIGDVATALTAVGTAIVAVAAVAMAFRWIKASMF